MGMQMDNQFQKSLEDFLSKITEEKNVIAVFLFGSLAKNDSWKKSDVDIAVILRDGVSKDQYISYSACEDSIDFEVNVFDRAYFMERLYDHKTLNFYRSMVETGKILYCKDEDIESLFERPIPLTKREQEEQLLARGTYASICRLKAEKHIFHTKDVRLAFDYINRYVNNLSCIEVLLHHQVYGREPECQAMQLNPAVFSSLCETIYENQITIDVLHELFERCDQYLRGHAQIIFQPLLSWLEKEESERGISEISGYIQEKYQVDNDLFQITNACNFLVEEKYLIRTCSLRTISSKSKVRVEQQAYAYNYYH